MKDNIINKEAAVVDEIQTEDEIFDELVEYLRSIMYRSLSPEVQKYVNIDNLVAKSINELNYSFKKDTFGKFNDDDIRLVARTIMISAF